MRMYPATTGADPDSTPQICFGALVLGVPDCTSSFWYDLEWINVEGALQLDPCGTIFGSSTIYPGNCQFLSIDGGTVDTIDGCDVVADAGRFIFIDNLASSEATLTLDGNLWMATGPTVFNDSNYNGWLAAFKCLDWDGAGDMKWVLQNPARLDDSGVLVVPSVTVRSDGGTTVWLDGADGSLHRVIVGADTDGGYSTTIEQQNDIVQIYTGDTGQNPDIDDLWLTYDAGAGLLSLEKPV
ncbi:MAG: hypothetical protein GY716_06230, partial [bacterium]|nr:hypothetical protein [bacterium]